MKRPGTVDRDTVVREASETDEQRVRLARRLTWVGGGVSACGLVVAGTGLAVGAGGVERVLHAYLVSFAFFLSLSLGALFFLMIQHLTRAGWSVGIRRLIEIPAVVTPMLGVAFLPIAVALIAGSDELYPWNGHPPAHAAEQLAADGLADGLAGGHGESLDEHGTQAAHAGHAGHGGEGAHGGHGALSPGKALYLSTPFFLLRWALYFAVWSLLAVALWRKSTAQDRDGEARWTVGMQRISAPGIIAYGVTLTLATVDLLMSLSPAWYSTIFGVYYFAGAVVGSLALLVVVCSALRAVRLLPAAVTAEHLHDVGKFLFGFVFFWGYIAFSQYLLIWYANLPESTFWFNTRGVSTAAGESNAWSWVAVALLVGHFALPFVGLMTRASRRNMRTLTFWSVWLLVFHWVDLWWVVMPELGPDLYLGLPELGTFAVVGGLYAIGLARSVARAQLVPVGDPRLGESLAAEAG